MNTYHFTVVLAGSVDLTEEVADGLYAAGCDDATPGMSNGVVSIDFHREAPTMEEAIQSAINNVRRAGHDVRRVEIEPAAAGPAA